VGSFPLLKAFGASLAAARSASLWEVERDFMLVIFLRGVDAEPAAKKQVNAVIKMKNFPIISHE